MPSTDTTPWQPANPERLARQFSRIGWLGFWIQVALLVIPFFLLFYVTFLSGPESTHRKGIDLGNYLSYGSLLVMIFTTYWFFTYTRLGPKILAIRKHAPPKRSYFANSGLGCGPVWPVSYSQ